MKSMDSEFCRWRARRRRAARQRIPLIMFERLAGGSFSIQNRPPGRMLALLPVLAASLLLGCATGATPHVVEVTNRTYQRTIDKADEPVFLRDRASHFHTDSALLPTDQKREEFYVRWTPATIARVTFEYRQVRVPDKVFTQTFDARGTQAHLFAVRGQAFVDGGAVSAWRVSLWDDAGACRATFASAAW